MKVAPVSADLLIKLALAAAVVGGAVYLANRARTALGDVLPDWSMPDLGAWVDGAGRFVGEVGGTLSDGAEWVGTYGGTAPLPNYDPATWSLGSAPEWNPFGIAMTPAQREVYDQTLERGTIFGDAWDWLARLGNQIPPTYKPSDPVRDVRRIDNALGY